MALVSLEADTGRTLTADEKEALDQIVARAGVNGEEIARAVKHMVEAETKTEHHLDWSALKARLRRK